jgi:hypothetical protein
MKTLLLFLSLFFSFLYVQSYAQSSPQSLEISYKNQERMAKIRQDQVPRTPFKRKPVRKFFKSLGRRVLRFLNVRIGTEFLITGTPSF